MPVQQEVHVAAFYGPEATLIVTLLMDLQHMLATIGGIIAAAAARQPWLLSGDLPARSHAPHLVGDARVGHPHHHPDHAHQAVRRLLPRHRARC